MTRITLTFGTLLILLGAGGFFATGANQVTSLIPAFVGIVLIGCALLSQLGHVMRMIFAHLAVLLGLVGGLGGIGMSLPKLLSGAELVRPVAVYMQLAMGILLIVYTALCVKSFIDARRARQSAAN